MKQHIIPQVYLKEFGFLKGTQHKISVLEKGINHTSTPSIKSFLAVEDLYNIKSLQGQDSLLLEQMHGEIEGFYKKLIHKVKLETILTNEEKNYLAHVVSNFRCRTISFFGFLISKLESPNINHFIDEIVVFNPDRKGFYDAINKITPSDKLKLLSFATIGHMTIILQQFNYMILKAEVETGWFTCDNPVIYETSRKDKFMDEGAQIFLPLSKDYCVYLWKENDDILKQFIPSFNNEDILLANKSLMEYVITKIGGNTDMYFISPTDLGYNRFN